MNENNFIFVAPLWSKNVFCVNLYCGLVWSWVVTKILEEPPASVCISTMKMEAAVSYGTLIPAY